jgi:hypothetical protein
VSAAAQQLLELARSVRERRDSDLVGVWPRAVAFLARQALEEAVSTVLSARATGSEACPARAQLLCLPTYAPTEAAHDATYLWGVLSRACHHHPYELAPTAEELDRWIAEVERLSEALWRSTAGQIA